MLLIMDRWPPPQCEYTDKHVHKTLHTRGHTDQSKLQTTPWECLVRVRLEINRFTEKSLRCSVDEAVRTEDVLTFA